MMREQMDNTMQTLQRQREELSLKMHLLGMEARDDWQAAEALWQKVEQEAHVLHNTADDKLDALWVSWNTLSLELSDKYLALRANGDDMKHKVAQGLSEGMADLRQWRDEIGLKAHLLNMEARKEWEEEAEPLWARLSVKLDKLKKDSGDVMDVAKHEGGEAWDKLASAADALKQDLAERYQRLKKDD
jgi:hypothetical protein